MKLKIDREADALYFTLVDSIVEDSEEVAPGIILDYNTANEVVGIEILHLSKRTSPINIHEILLQTSMIS